MPTIEVRELTKLYGKTRAVDQLTFTVHPGRVTGFLGPNGAGKSTTMRLVLGLDRPTAGSATIAGKPFAAFDAPLRTVGALLDPQAAHGGRTARNHLRVLAASNGIAARRVDEVLELSGIDTVARRRIKTFSLGMRQRLGIAAALLGDPEVLLLDEPTNGLDPEGIVWVRELMRERAREGGTVLVSSHLMSETAIAVDHLVILGRGRLLVDLPMQEFIDGSSAPRVRVRSADPARLRTVLTGNGLVVHDIDDEHFTVDGARAAAVGAIAAAHGIGIIELGDDLVSLEQAYLELTAGAAEFVAGGTVVGQEA